MNVRGHDVNPALVVIDVQNGFVSKGGSYDLLGMETAHYRAVVPKVAELIKLCREADVPIFYTQAVRERSGIDLLTKSHRILPKAREERIRKRPICVRGTWDADIVDEVRPAAADHVVVKRRDSAFQDTEIGVWLKSLGVNALVFCGIDTSICVETSLRDGFNNGYDVILVSDATASGNRKHFESTLEIVKEYYGIVMDLAEFAGCALQRPVQKA
ncbi:MAG: isochorismatase family cysteine hydrolase [Nitrososphaera sp.]|uniref:cysteine hydrolase family protein n=1 Tax=Nitrososphaera sp. TaxID=1971748 RepID=UPI00182D65B3|nr:isochorismatase family cysteine hydrolase [Nitrososphaera sp.]NWG38125.1 cysteine hydrolase [Nitrososphaera sp.]